MVNVHKITKHFITSSLKCHNFYKNQGQQYNVPLSYTKNGIRMSVALVDTYFSHVLGGQN